MAKRRATPDELELWRHVAQTVRPIKSKRKPAPPKEAAPSAPPTKPKAAKPAVPAAPPAKPQPPAAPAKPHELTHGLSHGIDRRQAERFRKGKLTIEPAFRALVLAFDYAEPQHGGEGALYVLLKRVRDKT